MDIVGCSRPCPVRSVRDPLYPQPASTVPPVAPEEENTNSSTRPTPDVRRTPGSTPSISAPEFYGAGTASVEERIYDSDVIVRATLVSTGDGQLGFRAVEYLKGSGAREFLVQVSTGGLNTSGLVGRESVLFLSLSEEGSLTDERTDTAEFLFTETADELYRGNLPKGYTIDTRNPVWLPAVPEQGNVVKGVIIDPEPITGIGPPVTVSLAELRSKIAWIEGGEGIEWYDECIRASLGHISFYRDWETFYRGPWTPYQAESEAPSGAGSGTVVIDFGTHKTYEYARVWLTGTDTHLFRSIVVDDDEVSSNGYSNDVVTARPLPSGTYSVFNHRQLPKYMPCNFTPFNSRLELIVTVTSSGDAVHEAFFDPVAIGSAVGADATNGVLEPGSFSLTGDGTMASLSKIAWESGQVTMELEPSLSLAGHHADFIALDGSVSLRLDLDDASETVQGTKRTLRWNVCEQPWESGDLLMLRISSSVGALTGVTNDGKCDGAPVFDEPSYTFTIPETATTTTVVGNVSATDPDTGDTVTYSITEGNKEGKFAIGGSTGEITVAGTLDYGTTPSYTLTVEASDGTNAATVTVGITVSRQSVTLSGLVASMNKGDSDSFTVSVSDLDSANSYTIRVTTDNSNIGFDGGCTDVQEDVTVPSGSTSHTGTFTLHGCSASGGTVKATLLQGTTGVATATQSVTVADPPPTPVGRS